MTARYGTIFDIGRFKGALAPGSIIIEDAHKIRLHPAIFALDDVLAVPQDWSFLTADGRLALDGTAINPFLLRKGRFPAIVPVDAETCSVIVETAGTIDEPVLFIGGDCIGNYYHWLVDFLPRLLVFHRNRALFASWGIRRIALIRDLPGFARELLDRIGIGPDDIVWIDGQRGWRFRSMHLLSNFSQYGHLHPFTLDLLRKMLRPAGRGPGTRMLYVSRHDARNRRVRNDEELFAALETWGFERVMPGELSFAEQERLFTEARVIVGAHGAGLTNLLFAGPHTTLIELCPAVKGLRHFRLLAERLGQRYVSVTADVRDMDVPGHHNSGFRVDPARVEQAVAQALSETPG
ncbi:MAG TPA: glycosyltransferase family 61 protein [Azospirillum sp.]|nr:glycosyltransferase family 61 protein [Azospirillum sp.]